MDDKGPSLDFKQGDICHFEIPVSDKARARSFYGEVFGWTFQDVPEMDYTLFQTPGKGMAVGGGLFTPSDQMPNKVINYLAVDSLEKTAERVVKFGGKAISPAIDIGGHGRMMHIADSEGNVIAMWEPAKGSR